MSRLDRQTDRQTDRYNYFYSAYKSKESLGA